MKLKVYSKALITIGITHIIFIVLIILAIIFYPGGTRFDTTFEGFNFLETFPSDLGRIVAINGENNLISRVFFMTAIISSGLVNIIYFTSIPFIIGNSKIARIFAILTAIVGVVFSLVFIAIALCPWDLYTNLHNQLIYTSAPMVLITSIFLVIAIFIEKKFKAVGYLHIILISLFAIFAVATIIGSFQDNRTKWAVRILGHTILIFCEAIIFSLQAFFTWKEIRNKIQNH